MIFPELAHFRLGSRIVGILKNVVHPPLVAACSREHAAHQMVLAIRVVKRVKGVVLIHTELLAGDKDRPRRSQGNVALSVPDGTGSHSRGSVVSGARDNFHICRQPQFLRDLRQKCAHHLVALVELRQLLLGNAADFQHLL